MAVTPRRKLPCPPPSCPASGPCSPTGGPPTGPTPTCSRRLSPPRRTAFAALVRRHGPLVLATARRATGNPADADDVFQATFLLLARNAAAVRNPAAVAGWLHGVAGRMARTARRSAARRRTHEAHARGPTIRPL